jgi:hypothetical protein
MSATNAWLRTSAFEMRESVMPSTVERVSGFLFFAAFIAADLLISHTAAVKVAGVSCVVTGITWMWKRSIGVGIEDRDPNDRRGRRDRIGERRLRVGSVTIG